MAEKKISTGELFDGRAEDYDHFVNSTVIGYSEILESLRQIAKLYAGSESPAILDLGIGSGNSTAAVLENFPKAAVTGCDLSPKMIEKTRERFGKYNYTGVCGNAADINYKEKFDLVISSLALHHLKDADKRKTYGKIFDALKPNGFFILADIMLPSDKKLNTHLHEKWGLFIAYKRGEEYRDYIFGLDGAHHQYAALNDNLKYLQQAGFRTEIYYRNLNSAIIICFR